MICLFRFKTKSFIWQCLLKQACFVYVPVSSFTSSGKLTFHESTVAPSTSQDSFQLFDIEAFPPLLKPTSGSVAFGFTKLVSVRSLCQFWASQKDVFSATRRNLNVGNTDSDILENKVDILSEP